MFSPRIVLIALRFGTTALMDAASISNVNAQEVTQYCEVIRNSKIPRAELEGDCQRDLTK
jgi:hypothetical protein